MNNNRISVLREEALKNRRDVLAWFRDKSSEGLPDYILDYACWHMGERIKEVVNNAKLECRQGRDSFYEFSECPTTGIGLALHFDTYDWLSSYIEDELDDFESLDGWDAVKPLFDADITDADGEKLLKINYETTDIWNTDFHKSRIVTFNLLCLYMVMPALKSIAHAQRIIDGLSNHDDGDMPRSIEVHISAYMAQNFRRISKSLNLEWRFTGRGLAIVLDFLNEVNRPTKPGYGDNEFDFIHAYELTPPDRDYEDEFKELMGV